MTEENLEVERLDRSVTEVLAGHGGNADPTVLWLAANTRSMPPPGLLARIEGTVRPPRASRAAERPGKLLTCAALAMCAAFLVQGIGNLLSGSWIASNIGEPFGPHAYREGAVALIAAAVCAAAAAVRRSWAGLSTLTCAPLALSLGAHGFTEIGVFAAGVALHLTQGTLGLLLIGAWWWDRRHRDHDVTVRRGAAKR